MKRPLGYTLGTLVMSVAFSTACSPPGNVEAPARSVTCTGCHGGNGMKTAPSVPRLAGQSTIYLSKQLRAYKTGDRQDPVMSALAEALSDEEIEGISAWYESLDPCAPGE